MESLRPHKNAHQVALRFPMIKLPLNLTSEGSWANSPRTWVIVVAELEQNAIHSLPHIMEHGIG